MIDGDFQGKVYLKKQVGYAFEVIDSSTIKNNKFEFEGIIDFPDMYLFDGKKDVNKAIIRF